jgi:hypothetical protein
MPAAPGPAPLRTRVLRRLLALAAGGALACASAELGLRWLLLSDGALARRWGANLRQPERFADPNSDDYWKLQWILQREHLLPAVHPDPEIGWLGAAEPGSYAHPGEARVQGRRPVLLFGDSYAQCATDPGECFQGLLEGSDLGREYALVNYGVGGYGVDQMYLLLRRVLPRFAAQKPIVVFAVMLDDDFNRSLLGVRCWPKSRARLEQGALRLESPGLTDPDEYLRAHPLAGWSWVWRLFVHRGGGAPVAERVAVNRALLDAVAAELDTAGLEHVFLFFNGEQTLFDEPAQQWSVDLARDFQRETGQPCVWTRPYLRAAAGDDPLRAKELFGVSGKGIGHYNAWGNRVAFEALRQGLLAPAAAPDLGRIRELCASDVRAELSRATRPVQLLGASARLAAHTREPCIRLQRQPGADGRTDLWLRAGAGGPTTLEIDLDGRYRRIAARAERAAVEPSGCVEGGVRVAFAVDGEARDAWTADAQGGSPAHPLELALGHARGLRITLELAGASEACGWIVLRGLELH